MMIIYTLYFALSFAVLMGLSFMILKIGAALDKCPQSTGAAKSGAITIVSGYLAIGAGGVFLVALVLPILQQVPTSALLLALGLACLALGLGFSNAVATLRAVATPPAPVIERAKAPAKAS